MATAGVLNGVPMSVPPALFPFHFPALVPGNVAGDDPSVPTAYKGNPGKPPGQLKTESAEGRSFCVPLFVYHSAFKILNVFQNELNVKHQ